MSDEDSTGVGSFCWPVRLMSNAQAIASNANTSSDPPTTMMIISLTDFNLVSII